MENMWTDTDFLTPLPSSIVLDNLVSFYGVPVLLPLLLPLNCFLVSSKGTSVMLKEICRGRKELATDLPPMETLGEHSLSQVPGALPMLSSK